MKRSIALRVLAVLLGVLAFSPAWALYHDEWTTYFFRNSKTAEISSFTIAWDAYGGVFSESTARKFSKQNVPTPNVYPDWDYVGYGHFDRGYRDCYLMSEYFDIPTSSDSPVRLQENDCKYPENRAWFDFGRLTTLSGMVLARLTAIAYLSPTVLLVSTCAFFFGLPFVQSLRLSRLMPFRFAVFLPVALFWVFGWDFLFGAEYNQFDMFTYVIMLLFAFPFCVRGFSTALGEKFESGKISVLKRFFIVQTFAGFLCVLGMALTGWLSNWQRFALAMTYVAAIVLAMKFGYLKFPAESATPQNNGKSPS